MSDDDSSDFDEAAVSAALGSHRPWTAPILYALESLGGSAKPSEVERRVREHSAGALTDLQWARVIKGKHLRFAKIGLKTAGFVRGKGRWEITERGRRYLDANRAAALSPPQVSALPEDEAGSLDAPLETVTATAFGGYAIPILQLIAEGSLPKQALYERLEDVLGPSLLAGDFRIMPSGTSVWSYRVSWCLTYLKRNGEAKNPTLGTWEITDAGRHRLAREGERFDLSAHQHSKVKVRAVATPHVAARAPASEHPPWSSESWLALRSRLPSALLSAINARIRPDLGPTPAARALARNLIFYGAPGTGKTHVARDVARALSGEMSPGPDATWRIVQFHPSYAYEDFIQGLRPDLEQNELRYQLRKGPFLDICEDASEDPDTFYVLVIDEINRGDPARIFGELLYALEYRGEAVDLPLGGQLTVPPNLVVLGTMNSVDRSVALVDYALRRRFAFVRLDPDSQTILDVRGDSEHAAIAADMLDGFNRWLIERLGREHVLGHSFFLNPAVPRLDDAGLEQIWQHDVLPLLEEYFFGEREALAEAAREWRRAQAQAKENVREAEDQTSEDAAS